jgi:trehalose synthase
VYDSVPIAPMDIDAFRAVLSPEQVEALDGLIANGAPAFAGRVIWNVNSTANGGGVAEMLRSLVAYARGAGVDARWLVVEGSPAFFEVTKRLHNRLHGSAGDGGDLGSNERAIFESVSTGNARDLAAVVSRHDIVLLHDPQTAGLVAPLKATGAHVIWRCHIGVDEPDDLARSGWQFLVPYVEEADAYVFSRHAYAWEGLDQEKLAIIPPSIDAFSAKNQLLSDEAVEAILHVAGIGDLGRHRHALFHRPDGSPARVDRNAHLWHEAPLSHETPIVTQVSRWDRLKDPLGVIDAFLAHVPVRTGAHLVLAGPDVSAVTDDPEGLEVLQECIARRKALPLSEKQRIHLAAMPMEDADENAAIVNALQRRSNVLVQKSLAEGFGLTVAEGMWKARPVVASRIGGIQDQIVDGVSGRLVDPLDFEAFGAAVAALLDDPGEAASIGAAAQARVRDHFLGPRHLGQYFDLFTGVIAG